MIRNEAEYQEASGRLSDERNRLADHRARLREAGLSDEEIKRVTDPMESFHLQLKEEVESYERLKRGEFEELDNLHGLGQLLISLRIAAISQRELARRLNVHESQVSRDERNEYFGITLERAVKILDALNIRLHSKVEIEPLRPMAFASRSGAETGDGTSGRDDPHARIHSVFRRSTLDSEQARSGRFRPCGDPRFYPPGREKD
jgi:transcriptional regulator with XRE-family HTH domain